MRPSSSPRRLSRQSPRKCHTTASSRRRSASPARRRSPEKRRDGRERSRRRRSGSPYRVDDTPSYRGVQSSDYYRPQARDRYRPPPRRREVSAPPSSSTASMPLIDGSFYPQDLPSRSQGISSPTTDLDRAGRISPLILSEYQSPLSSNPNRLEAGRLTPLYITPSSASNHLSPRRLSPPDFSSLPPRITLMSDLPPSAAHPSGKTWAQLLLEDEPESESKAGTVPTPPAFSPMSLPFRPGPTATSSTRPNNMQNRFPAPPSHPARPGAALAPRRKARPNPAARAAARAANSGAVSNGAAADRRLFGGMMKAKDNEEGEI